MGKQKRPATAHHSRHGHSSSKKANSSRNESDAAFASWLYSGTAVCVIAIVVYFVYQGYLETRVNTPFKGSPVVTKTGLDIPDLYWGSYRPGAYFGMKTRHPHSLVTGLMWYSPNRAMKGELKIRHWCDQGDDIDKYGWIAHDGRTFGIQEIYDGPVKLTTSFVKRIGGVHGGDWTARISVEPRTKDAVGERISLMFYLALDEGTVGSIDAQLKHQHLSTLQGEVDGLGRFAVTFINNSAVEHSSHLITVAPGLHELKETVLDALRVFTKKESGHKIIGLAGKIVPANEDGTAATPNFYVHEVTVQVPFAMEVLFESASFQDRTGRLQGDVYDSELENYHETFLKRFRDIFPLKQYNATELAFAQAMLSNMVGGIAYFYGASLVQSVYNKNPVPYWPAPLYTAVPSRSFFPRGFLWDEGFHNLLISKWDLDISLDIIAHWFDLLNVEGWIPREQILGRESRVRVPAEFVVQKNTNANPPTLLLSLHAILMQMKDNMTIERYSYLERLWPRLQAWYQWFNTTQIGSRAGTYQWKGRDAHTNRELNPKTLTSGFDDYPRASHPSEDEYHIDLRCWMALASGLMAKIANIIGRDGERYSSTYKLLSDNALLDALHWSDQHESYADYGLHTDYVSLTRPPSPPPTSGKPPVKMEKVRTIHHPPHLQFVNTFGYVNLFPFLLEILEPSSPKLGVTLQRMSDPKLLWTPYGLRSISTISPLYMKHNTEHDAPYWRGPIWINVNYLAVRALGHYAKVQGPYQEQAKNLHVRLRKNIVSNVFKEYQRTGYVWEQYDDKTGRGKSSRPFTGWTALTLLVMAEDN